MNYPIELNLLKYYFSNISLTEDPNFKNNNEPIDLNPTFERNIVEIDKNIIKVSLTFKTNANFGKAPFALSLTINGIFERNNYEESEEGIFLSETTTVRFLFPYLRQAITSIVSTAGYPPYVLPVVDVTQLFK